MIQQIQNTSILDSLVCIFILRREGDSNPRSTDWRTTVFETAAFDRSAISPLLAAFPMEFIPPLRDDLSISGASGADKNNPYFF
jgi:hypothetical protein